VLVDSANIFVEEVGELALTEPDCLLLKTHVELRSAVVALVEEDFG
jgi:hypothetical protein